MSTCGLVYRGLVYLQITSMSLFYYLVTNTNKKRTAVFLKCCFKAELTQLGDGLEWEEKMHIKLLPPHVCFSSC